MLLHRLHITVSVSFYEVAVARSDCCFTLNIHPAGSGTNSGSGKSAKSKEKRGKNKRPRPAPARGSERANKKSKDSPDQPPPRAASQNALPGVDAESSDVDL